jgi:hypothetical protein
MSRMNKPISSREEQLNVRRYNEKVMHAQLKQVDDSIKRIEEIRKEIIILRKANADRDALKAKAVREAVKPVEVAKPKSLKRKKQLEEMESLHKEIKQTKIPDLSSRKHQLVEMEMLKKEIEHSKIPDIKIDSSIEEMISKLDALTKSKSF